MNNVTSAQMRAIDSATNEPHGSATCEKRRTTYCPARRGCRLGSCWCWTCFWRLAIESATTQAAPMKA